jgi:hypothetical protein
MNIGNFNAHAIIRGFSFFAMLGLLASCGSEGKKHKIDLVSTSSIKPRDSLSNLYYNNSIFSPRIIRLGNGSNKSFVFVDSAFFGAKHLSKSEREDYYSKVKKLLPQKDLEVHTLVWAIPELKKQQLGDGGYGSSFSLIAERPSVDKPEYLVEIHLNNIDEYPFAAPISLLKVHMERKSVQIADKSGYFVSMHAWRAGNK